MWLLRCLLVKNRCLHLWLYLRRRQLTELLGDGHLEALIEADVIKREIVSISCTLRERGFRRCLLLRKCLGFWLDGLLLLLILSELTEEVFCLVCEEGRRGQLLKGWLPNRLLLGDLNLMLLLLLRGRGTRLLFTLSSKCTTKNRIFIHNVKGRGRLLSLVVHDCLRCGDSHLFRHIRLVALSRIIFRGSCGFVVPNKEVGLFSGGCGPQRGFLDFDIST